MFFISPSITFPPVWSFQGPSVFFSFFSILFPNWSPQQLDFFLIIVMVNAVKVKGVMSTVILTKHHCQINCRVPTITVRIWSIGTPPISIVCHKVSQ